MGIPPSKHNGFAVDVGKGVYILALNEVPIFEAGPRPANVYDHNLATKTPNLT